MNLPTSTITTSARNGTAVESRVELGIDRRRLLIRTTKGSRGVSCHAQVVQMAPDGVSFSFMMYQDYSQILCYDRAARATKKNLLAIHAAGLGKLEALGPAIAAQYPGATLP